MPESATGNTIGLLTLARVHRQKLEEVAQIETNILSIVSHDMRTPLTSILLYAQMLTEELNSLGEEDQLNFLKIISGECTRLSRLVDDLLEDTRPGRHTPTYGRLPELLAPVVERGNGHPFPTTELRHREPGTREALESLAPLGMLSGI